MTCDVLRIYENATLKMHSVAKTVHFDRSYITYISNGVSIFVWHTNVPKYLSDNIEIIQKRCLKTIFPGYQYENILQMVNLPTLHRRRDELCRVYFAKTFAPTPNSI